jgi:hypothetical protein
MPLLTALISLRCSKVHADGRSDSPFGT